VVGDGGPAPIGTRGEGPASGSRAGCRLQPGRWPAPLWVPRAKVMTSSKADGLPSKQSQGPGSTPCPQIFCKAARGNRAPQADGGRLVISGAQKWLDWRDEPFGGNSSRNQESPLLTRGQMPWIEATSPFQAFHFVGRIFFFHQLFFFHPPHGGMFFPQNWVWI